MQLQKTSAWRNLFIFKAPLLCANHFFLINHTRKLFWHSNVSEPQRKNFILIIIQLLEVDIQPSSELFHSHKKRKDSLETRAEPAVFF